MKLGVILETKEAEKAWNAFRLALTALEGDHEVRFFLMGEAVECESINQGKFDVAAKMQQFQENGGELLACGTCLKSRQKDDFTSCPISTMQDCLQLIIWADKVVTF